jgi:hypothetical protein
MHLPLFESFRERARTAVAMLRFPTVVFAVSAYMLPIWVVGQQSQPTRVELEARQTALAEGRRVARVALARGDGDSADIALSDAVSAKPGTSIWHLGMGHEYTQLGLMLSREADAKGCRIAAERALRQFELAARLASSSGVRANALTGAGFVYERLLGDNTSAISAYRAANTAEPQKATTAAERLARLEQVEAQLRSRPSGGGRL